MEGEDIINLPASSNSASGTESGELRDLDDGLHEVYSHPNNAETKDGEIKSEIPDLNEGDMRNLQSHLIVEAEVDNTLVDNSSDMQISDEITETVRVEEKWDDISSGAHSESVTVEGKIDGSTMPTKKRKNGSPIQNHMMDGICILLLSCYTKLALLYIRQFYCKSFASVVVCSITQFHINRNKSLCSLWYGNFCFP